MDAYPPSPKVAVPAVAVLGVGLIFYLTGDHSAGLALILAALGFGGGGSLLPPTRRGGYKVTQADLEAHAAQLARRRR